MYIVPLSMEVDGSIYYVFNLYILRFYFVGLSYATDQVSTQVPQFVFMDDAMKTAHWGGVDVHNTMTMYSD